MASESAPPVQPSGLVSRKEDASAFYQKADYRVLPQNWYSAKPYGFKFTPKTGEAMVMFLPINPSNLTITTNFATNVVPTIYGTVEEHSPVRYYDITIEGTTGMAPKYIEPASASLNVKPAAGRKAFTVKHTPISDINLAGFLNKTLTRAKSIYSEVTSLISTPKTETGLSLEQTGYVAFHNLYRFLLQYKKDAAGVNKGNSGERKQHPLIFFNYKDNNQYKVVIKSMTLRRDKEDPMLYHYHISMRGYDLETAGTNEISKDAVSSLLGQLGLDGVDGSSFLQEAKKKANQARGILSSVANGINQLGR